MERKYVVQCSIAFVLILLQVDVIDSRGSRGGSRSGSSKINFWSSSSRSGSSRSTSSSSSHKIKSHSDSSRSGSSFSNGSGKRYWSYNSPAGSSTSYRRPTQEPNLYSQNYRYSSRYPWDSYDAKPWRPKPPKAKLKDVAGEVIVGAAGGFLLGGSLSHMELYFWDPKEERWWYEHRDSYPDMVYFRNYDQRPAPFMTFIEDCVNITVSKFIVNQTDEMEIKVVPHVVRQMCKEEYIENLFRPSRERKPGEIAKMTNTGGAVITSFEGISSGHDMVVALDTSFLVMLFFLTKLLCY